MRLVTFRDAAGKVELGALAEGSVISLTRACPDDSNFSSMLALIEGGETVLDKARAIVANPPAVSVVGGAEIQLLAPIPTPPRMRASSFDPQHLIQAKTGYLKMLRTATGNDDKEEDPVPEVNSAYFETPVYWFLDHYCVSGPEEHVTWPAYSDWVDYELEIAAVIGKRGKDVKRDEAEDYIFGYTILNDLSARDAQFTATATGLTITAKGKDFEGSYPMGPCIVTRDEIEHGDMVGVLRVNGEEWGRGTTKGGHWTFADAIAYASQANDLIPGEIITSATVANCCGLELARKGARGDCVELEVEPIGCLRTWID